MSHIHVKLPNSCEIQFNFHVINQYILITVIFIIYFMYISINLSGLRYYNKSTAHGCWTLDFFISDIKLQAIYSVIHTSNLSTDWGQHFLQVY